MQTRLFDVFRMGKIAAAQWLDQFSASEGEVSASAAQCGRQLIDQLIEVVKHGEIRHLVLHLTNTAQADVLLMIADSADNAQAALTTFFEQNPKDDSFKPKLIWIDTKEKPKLT